MLFGELYVEELIVEFESVKKLVLREEKLESIVTGSGFFMSPNSFSVHLRA